MIDRVRTSIGYWEYPRYAIVSRYFVPDPPHYAVLIDQRSPHAVNGSQKPAKIKYSERHALDGTRRPSPTWVMMGTEMLKQAEAYATRVETLLQC
jgi:hypothetical protein